MNLPNQTTGNHARSETDIFELLDRYGCDLFTFSDGKIAIKNSYRKNRPAT